MLGLYVLLALALFAALGSEGLPWPAAAALYGLVGAIVWLELRRRLA